MATSKTPGTQNLNCLAASSAPWGLRGCHLHRRCCCCLQQLAASAAVQIALAAHCKRPSGPSMTGGQAEGQPAVAGVASVGGRHAPGRHAPISLHTTLHPGLARRAGRHNLPGRLVLRPKLSHAPAAGHATRVQDAQPVAAGGAGAPPGPRAALSTVQPPAWPHCCQ